MTVHANQVGCPECGGAGERCCEGAPLIAVHGTLPRHPIQELTRMAYATPNPCEGSLGHIRQDFAWDLKEDWRKLMVEHRIPTGYHTTSVRNAKRDTIQDAILVLTIWTNNPGSA